jgi:3-hydroxybutyryl-CoA dehydrogenase
MATRSSKLYDDTTTVRVAIIGAGLMGAQIGCEYALGRHDVVFHARDLDGVRARVDAAFALVSAHGLRSADELAKAARRVSVAADPGAAASDADLVVESLPEDLELKASVLRIAGDVAPAAVVATNTSSLSISAIGEAIGRPEQTVGTHYLNPPLLMRPVEVIAGERTSGETVEFVCHTLAALGKLPIVVQRDVPGFVWNRLQFALVRECAWLVENGVASAEEVDTVVREGLARRWGRVGPLRSIALGGIETWNRSGRNIVPQLSNASELQDLSMIAIMDGDLAADAAARDAGLARDLHDDHAKGRSS